MPPKIKETFRIDIKVHVPEAKGKVEIGDEVTAISKFDYTIGPFKVGSAHELVKGSIKKHVYEILHELLPAATRNEIINGKLAGGEKIEVHGYTSNTDSESRNFKLSKERAKTVLAEFRSLGAPAGIFTEPIPHGEWETPNPTDDKREEKEDSEFRKIVLKIQHEMTFKIDPTTGQTNRID